MLNIVISTKTISKEKKTFHLAELGDGSSVFINEDQISSLGVGTMVAIVTKKFRQKDGKWSTSKTVVPVKVQTA